MCSRNAPTEWQVEHRGVPVAPRNQCPLSLRRHWLRGPVRIYPGLLRVPGSKNGRYTPRPRTPASTTARELEIAAHPPRQSRHEHRMVEPARREPKRSLKIFPFQVRHLLEDLLLSEPGREEIENIAHANTHATNTRPPSALLWIYRDSFGQLVHDRSIAMARVCRRPGLYRLVSRDERCRSAAGLKRCRSHRTACRRSKKKSPLVPPVWSAVTTVTALTASVRATSVAGATASRGTREGWRSGSAR